MTNQWQVIFSTEWIRAFAPGLEGLGRQYSTLAKSVYRECSEFVHGNFSTQENVASDAMIFDSDKVLAFSERADTVRLCVVMAFACRYLFGFQPTEKTIVESIMLETLGTIPIVRQFYDK